MGIPGSNQQSRTRQMRADDQRCTMGVEAKDIRGKDAPSVFSLLAIEFEPGDDGTGQVVLTLSGDREIRLDVESLNASVTDVTRPYTALSRNKPEHGFD